jgi:hypothetical protein
MGGSPPVTKVLLPAAILAMSAQARAADDLPDPPVAAAPAVPSTTTTTTTTATTSTTTTPQPTPTTTATAATIFAGYAEAQMFAGDAAGMKLRRAVFAAGHRFSDWLDTYGAVEIEDGASVGVEQAVLEVQPDRRFGARAGLLLVPLGIINQLNDPATYLTVDRPLTDQLIIPTTWRELGAGVFGDVAERVAYQGYVTAGLDGAGLSADAPLRGAGGNGRDVGLHDVAVSGRLDVTAVAGLDVGAGGYYGGATGGHPQLAVVRVGLAEADARYRGFGFDLRAEYAYLSIVDSWKVNDYLGLTGAADVPARGRGYYLQAGYDLFHLLWPAGGQELIAFAGYENVNPRSSMSPYNNNPPAITPANQPLPNAPSDPRPYARGGLAYRPRAEVAIKSDLQIALKQGDSRVGVGVAIGF